MSNSKFQDREYLRKSQYQSADNLNARISLHENYSTNPIPWLAWVFHQMEIPEGAAILELGAGNGKLWAQNHEAIAAEWTMLLSDLSVGMLASAREVLRAHRNINFSSCDAQAIPIENESVEIVIANHMLYHLPDVHRAIAEVHRILRPGGKFYAATNGIAHLSELRNWAQEAIDPKKGKVDFHRIWADGMSGFSLESGEDSFGIAFDNVQLILYEDDLQIDAVEPILAFVGSSSLYQPSKMELARLKDYLEAKLKTDGLLEVSKKTGLFVAEKAK